MKNETKTEKSFVTQWQVTVAGKVRCFGIMMQAVRYAAKNGGIVKAIWDEEK